MRTFAISCILIFLSSYCAAQQLPLEPRHRLAYMEAFLEEVRTQLSIVPGANITIGQPIAHRIDHMLSGTRANIAIKVFGTDLNQLFTIGNRIKRQIEGIPGKRRFSTAAIRI